MIKKLVCFLFVIIFALTLVSCKKEKGNTGSGNNKEIGYVYPEDLNFTATDSFADVLAVPDDILKNMSTEGLVQTILNVPSEVILVMSSSADGKVILFDEFIKEFNVIKELSDRFDKTDYIKDALDKYVTDIDKKVNAQYIKMLEYCLEKRE